MSFEDELDELGRLYTEKDYEGLSKKLEDIEDPVVFCAYLSLIEIEDGEFEKGQNRIKAFDIENYLDTERVRSLKIFRFASLRAGVLEHIEKISTFFYEITEDPREMFMYYDCLICSRKTYEESKKEIQFIIDKVESVEDILKFTGTVIYGIILKYNDANDERIYELAYNLQETFLINSNIYNNIIRQASINKNNEFIIKFVEKIIPYMHFDYSTWLDFFDAYDYYLQAKLNLGLEITKEDMEKMRYNYRYICKYHREFLVYIDEIQPELDTFDTELIKILNKKRVKLSTDDVKVYKYLLEEKFDKLLDLFVKNKWYYGILAYYAENMKFYQESIYDNFIKYIIDITNSEDDIPMKSVSICVTEHMYSRNNIGEGNRILSQINVDKEIDKIYNFVIQNSKEVKDRNLLILFGEQILKQAKDEYAIRKAKELLTGYYFYINNVELFYKYFVDIEDYIDNDFARILHRTDDNEELIRFLIDKKIPAIGHFYLNCISRYTAINEDKPQDFERAAEIAEMVDSFFDDYPELCNFSRNCVSVHKGINKYYFGEFDEAERILREAAYTSEDYCNCGVSALMTLYDYVKPEESEAFNKKLTKNSIDGLKLIGDDKYSEEKFENHHDVVFRYAYYALKEEEGFDKSLILNILYRKDSTIVGSYYLIKLLKALGDVSKIPRQIEAIKTMMKDGYTHSTSKFLEILDDIDCPLYLEQSFDMGIKINFKL